MDRNTTVLAVLLMYSWSLSARRAWIEIAPGWRVSGRTLVALRKESVDRNPLSQLNLQLLSMSLSARRAWIEILMLCQTKKYSGRRSPQGERG